MSTPLPDRPALFDHLLASKPNRERRSAVTARSSSILGHAFIVGGLVWATLAAADVAKPSDDPIMLVEFPEPELPLPPPTPVVKTRSTPIDQPTWGSLRLPMPTIVPPTIPPIDLSAARIDERDWSGRGEEGGVHDGVPGGRKVTVDNLPASRPFTVFTLAPRLENQDDVARALERNYPPLLRDAGIGGTTIVWFFIDETGTVVERQLHRTSGYDALDAAALKVADLMRFTPAMNRDRVVKVWVQIPITFTAK